MTKPNHKLKCDCFRNEDEWCWISTAILGWLDSGVKDINGEEIYEGNRVIFGEHNKKGVIIFKDGAFGISYKADDKELFCPLYHAAGFIQIEIVGHVAEETES